MTQPHRDAVLLTQLAPAYAAARQAAGLDVPVVVLHIGAEHTAVAVGSGTQAHALHTVPLGFARTARAHFRTTPPTPLALENAIATVEDCVMPMRPLLPREARLFTQDAALRDIATLAGASPGQPLTLEAMERCFDDLTAVVLGTPAARLGLPDTQAFAATLLILREFMHHMQFAQMEVLAP